jgi:hypothetical protein
MIQFAVALANARAGQIGTTVGASGTLVIYTGARPGIANSVTGTLLSTLTTVAYSSTSGVTTITATQDGSAVASGTPGYGRFKASGGTAYVEGSAGIGVQATAGAVTIVSTAITAVAVSAGGSGYLATDPPVILVSGTGYGAVLSAVISGGAVASITVVNGGTGYSGTPAVTIMPGSAFLFTTTISLGGTVALTAGSVTEGNL